MPQQISGANGIIIIKLRRFLGYMICLLGLVCLFVSPTILFVLILEKLHVWIDVVLISSFVTTVWIYLPALRPTWTIFIAIDCIARLLLIDIFLTYWSFWHTVWINRTPIERSPFPPFVLGIPIGNFISIITSYIISFALWRSRYVQLADVESPTSQRPEPQTAAEEARAARERAYNNGQGKQEEQRRIHEEACRHRERQAASDLESTTKTFPKWREDCRTSLQAPELITKMPCPPRVTCSDIACKTRSSSLGVCSHDLRMLYLDSKLEEKEVKGESRLWHPNGAKVNRVEEGCTRVARNLEGCVTNHTRKSTIER
jgi:hypothetical protein